VDVAVVGGGLGGLAAGVAARRAGHTVTVLERAPELRETGTGIGLMPNGVRALDVLGVGGPVRGRADPLSTGGGLRDRHGRPLLAVDQAAVAARAGAPVVVVDRAWLHRLLAAALPPGAVRTGAAVTAVRDDGGRVRIEGSDAAVDAVLVADGAASRLRDALFPGHPGLEGSGRTASKANWRASACCLLGAGGPADRQRARPGRHRDRARPG
jgi:2-polyprenyl-6-methoxyphenol hydroxylase-like FAD-dependent oxidoreductase